MAAKETTAILASRSEAIERTPAASLLSSVGAACAFILLLETVDHVASALQLPLLRASVACPPPPPAPHAADGGAWSGSAACADAPAVLRAAQRVEGQMVCASLLSHMLCAPLLAVAADVRSRSLALGLSAACKLGKLALLALLVGAAPHALRRGGEPYPSLPLPLLLAAAALGGAGAANVPLNALLGDLSPAAARGRVFTALTLAHAAAGLGSTLLAATLLHLRLADYTFPLAALAALAPLSLAPLAALAAREPRRAPAEPHARGCGPLPRLSAGGAARLLAAGTRSLARLFARSARLRALSASFACIGFGAGGATTILASFSIGVLGWAQGDLEYLALLAAPFAVGSLVAGNVALVRYGAARVACASISTLCVAVSLLVFAPWFPPVVMLMVCLTGSSIILFPATLDLFTEAFETQERAQAQALVVTAVTFAISLAAPCFSSVFDPSATGARAAVPFAIAAIACMLGLGLAVQELAFHPAALADDRRQAYGCMPAVDTT
ncbi:hypothetical protein AB1Y20_002922 [Prymnesium parvum]|uniref:Major facilitator superfamily (MFS) profile domain-containing protein n=1 Tax=Prymnesium parvum TaxID=97485 RepID=A0AB34JD58_PRYPA